MADRNVPFFRHDAGARHDPRLIAAKMDYGVKIVGLYWQIVELLREQRDYTLTKDKTTIATIAYDAMIDNDEATTMLDSMIDLGLFEVEDGRFFSSRLMREMERMASISEERARAGAKGGQASGKQRRSKSQANASQKPSNSEANRSDKSREEKSREEESRVERATDVYLSDSEYSKLCADFGTANVDSKIDWLAQYQVEKDHFYKSAYLTLRNWLKKDGAAPPAESGNPDPFFACPHCGGAVYEEEPEICPHCHGETGRAAS